MPADKSIYGGFRPAINLDEAGLRPVQDWLKRMDLRGHFTPEASAKRLNQRDSARGDGKDAKESPRH